jgi:hypothetical protein
LREICPRKKCPPNIGANIGTITGILLRAHNVCDIIVGGDDDDGIQDKE